MLAQSHAVAPLIAALACRMNIVFGAFLRTVSEYLETSFERQEESRGRKLVSSVTDKTA